MKQNTRWQSGGGSGSETGSWREGRKENEKKNTAELKNEGRTRWSEE